MRIISGKFKGRKLFTPMGKKIRPTSDRVKETIFNILAARGLLIGSRILDLFSGTGSLGIEALSQGAKEAVFIDIDADSVALIKKNLLHVCPILIGEGGFVDNEGEGIGLMVQVFQADFKVALRRLAGKEFDLIFLDPPYKFYSSREGGWNKEKKNEKDFGFRAIGAIVNQNILSESGIIVYERAEEAEELGTDYLQIDQNCYTIQARRVGRSQILFIQRAV